MGLFGYSLPPGCSTLPGEEDEFCETCSTGDLNKCICPECKVCGEYGRPECYKEHGLIKTEAQIIQVNEFEKLMNEQNQAVYEAEILMDKEADAFWAEMEEEYNITYEKRNC